MIVPSSGAVLGAALPVTWTPLLAEDTAYTNPVHDVSLPHCGQGTCAVLSDERFRMLCRYSFRLLEYRPLCGCGLPEPRLHYSTSAWLCKDKTRSGVIDLARSFLFKRVRLQSTGNGEIQGEVQNLDRAGFAVALGVGLKTSFDRSLVQRLSFCAL